MQQIKIKLKAFDHRALEKASKEIVSVVKETASSIIGPIPLPMHIQKFTVNKSPHVNKKSREQFEIRTKSRLIIINLPTANTMRVLQSLELPAGVDVQINQGNER